ncbi:hypothetical protein OEZ86_002229 [Tetradesmus obliquus]|nr:hypothetical protein OEZ86_002229 [Tetradesmus obliquus]
MDADEALARALQEEEVAAARQQQPQPGTPDAVKAALLSLIQNSLAQALSVEDAELQARARALAPLEQLWHEAQEAADLNALLLLGEQQAAGGGGSGVLGLQDFMVQGLLRWFKRDFFSWVDQPACELCGCPTSGIGMVQPTAAEARDGAGRVEAYRCNVCQQVTRFPRYARPAKLLDTRRGRCGEWAHTFLLVLRAAGLDARHITDNADHVWCEYYSAALGRWVHVDACEEAWDTPLLYEGGWGKSLAHVFGSSRHGVTDVTRRYVVQPESLPSRRVQVPEAWLAATLARLSNPLRAALDTSTRREVAMRDAAEALQLMSLEDGGSTAAAAASLPGRQSGAEAWRSARGEAGSQASTAQPSRARLPTPYQRAGDAALPQLFTSAGRITGGACRASDEHRGGQPGQQACRAFDGSSSSKWLDFGGGGAGGTAWLEYRLLPGQEALVLSHYDVMAADDCPERDPADWILECQYPSNAKFWQLGTSSSKIQPVLSHPALLGLLLQLGFRPVLGAAPGAAAAAGGRSVRLVADECSRENAEAVRLLSSAGT